MFTAKQPSFLYEGRVSNSRPERCPVFKTAPIDLHDSVSLSSAALHGTLIETVYAIFLGSSSVRSPLRYTSASGKDLCAPEKAQIMRTSCTECFESRIQGKLEMIGTYSVAWRDYRVEGLILQLSSRAFRRHLETSPAYGSKMAHLRAGCSSGMRKRILL